MPARRLLVFSYYFPPDRSIGSARWAAMSEWLRRAGHEVTVLTSERNGREEDDGPWVQRAFDVGAVASARRLLRRSPPAQTRGGRSQGGWTRGAQTQSGLYRPPPRWLTDVAVPDECLLTWAPFALARARRLVREREIDCVVTSGPPHSTHLLAPLLGRHPAWVADLRDGWRFESLRFGWPTRAQDRLDARLERWSLGSADAVIGVTRPIARDAGERLGVPSAYVPNGWNPMREERLRDAARPPLERGRVNLVYTGTLSGPRGRDPRPLFAALGRLTAERPALASRLRIVLAGQLGIEEQRLLATLGLDGAVEHVGSLSHDGAAALQRDADVLLLLTAPGHTSEATGKLFDYLTAGRPILALARENEASRIVRETGTGWVVAPDDVDAIMRALAGAAEGTLAGAYKPHGLGRYTYPGPATEVAELIERAIARRAASVSGARH
jgi:glycosyltransferase involved in cell wall biosynthesis